MRHTTTALTLAFVAAAAIGLGTTARARALPQDEPGAGYAWADSCKTCHEAIYEAWSRTKHARAIGRLSSSDQAKECIGCHVTGPPTKIEKDGKFVNQNVQCEGCHGKGAAHVASPSEKGKIARKPPASACEACHSPKSPHFRGFYYEGMLAFSHPLPKK